jgi:hypothetical protein
MKMLNDTVAKTTTAYNTAASGGASTITIAAATGERWTIDWVAWSYAADPTAGALTITDATTSATLFSVDITVGGPGEFIFHERGLQVTAGSGVTITLADGSQTKKLNVQYR